MTKHDEGGTVTVRCGVGRITINWREGSTLRGAIVLATVAVTALLLVFGETDAAVKVYLGGMGLVGGAGLLVNDRNG